MCERTFPRWSSGARGRLAFALVLALALASVPAPPVRGGDAALLRGPYLQSLLDDSVRIRWTTSESALAATIRCFAPDGAEPRTFEARTDCATLAAGETCHEAVLTALLPDSRYRYEILDGEDPLPAGEPLTFKTPPRAGGGVIHMAVLGDSGVAKNSQFAVADILRDFAPEAILHSGDLDYLGDPDRSIFSPYADLLARACLFPARGNHDNDIPFERIFALPGVLPDSPRTYYAFDWGPARFIVLDSTLRMEDDPPDCRQGDGAADRVADLPDCAGLRPTPGEIELSWLCEALDAARLAARPWTIVLMHDPMFTAGPQAPSSERLRHLLGPLFDAHGVDLVLCGDDHNYQASEPVRMRAARTCGDRAPLDCEERDAEGELIDPEACYEVVRGRSTPNYAFPEGSARGTIYVVTGGGGQLLYPRYLAAEDTPFSRVFRSEWHALELRVSPATLALKAVSIRGETLDTFTISKLRFLRGDLNFDRVLDIADAVAILSGLFLGTSLPCLPAGDIDGDGFVLIGDPIALLSFMFLGTAPPAPPFPACGPIPRGSPRFCERTGC